MHLLLVAATAFEIDPARRSGPFPDSVDLVITGVGLLAASYHIQKAIATRKPGLVIQAGVAGTFDPSAVLGTVVVVGEEFLADLGVEEQGEFRSVFDMGLAGTDAPPFVSGRLPNPQAGSMAGSRFPVARAITVQEISTRPERIGHYRRTYSPYVESMEGAALHYVCLQENVSFLQVRALSNYVGERDKRQWQMDLAIRNLNTAVGQIIEQCKTV